ncbi:Transposase IS200 like protein [Planctomycetes bacterium Pla163]|uniref:Transposase IS200 like protein n=1 Tax=Rohdeia mirabilis TaxID=2528008 RepID=A0A518D0S6_9BACT|nr:Transposase IS200 like protein [Planctomycetes bacterium Pla163]
MARTPRYDAPGLWHHVYNRGIARRPIFETVRDKRAFLAALAWQVRRGTLEVHAFSILATHYHLLIRSPDGSLSAAMQWVQTSYSRYFNRRRKRDGALVRGRFGSKLVEGGTYRRNLVRYIDNNVVVAGIGDDPCNYPFGSAWHYARSRGAPWLERSWVESDQMRRDELEAFSPKRYRERACAGIPDSVRESIERRVRGRRHERGTEESLDRPAGRVVERLRRSANIADGGTAWLPLTSLPALVAEVDRVSASAASGDELLRGSLLVGLGRQLVGATQLELATRLDISISTCRRLASVFGERLTTDLAYSALVESVVRTLQADWE